MGLGRCGKSLNLSLALQGFSGPPHAAFALSYDPRAAKEKHEQEPASRLDYESELSIRIGRAGHHPGKHPVIYQPQSAQGKSPPLSWHLDVTYVIEIGLALTRACGVHLLSPLWSCLCAGSRSRNRCFCFSSGSQNHLHVCLCL